MFETNSGFVNDHNMILATDFYQFLKFSASKP